MARIASFLLALFFVSAAEAQTQTTASPQFNDVVGAFTPATIVVAVIAIGVGIFVIRFTLRGIAWLREAL